MFPKNRINIVYRLLCLLCFMAVIIFIKSTTTLLILFVAYCVLGLSEMAFRNIEFVVVTLLCLLFCYFMDNYILFKAALLISYIFYFIDSSSYREKDNEKKKGSSNITAIYLTVHLVILFIAIMVG